MLPRKMIIGMIMAVLVSMGTAAWGVHYYVDPNGDNSDGLSWVNAFHTIQQGIDASVPTVVEVNECTYYETIDFNGVSCTVTSTDPNDWEVVENTIIDANGATRGVYFQNSENAYSVLRGFTITGGTDGVYCNSASPTISNCIIEDNNEYGVYLYLSSVTIEKCVIKNNNIFGILASGSTSTTIRYNEILENSYTGICLFASSAIVKSNWIYDNGLYGVESHLSDSAVLRNNTIVGNTTAGIHKAYGTQPSISNCILWGNSDDLSNCTATYSCIEDGDSGTGNISSYPYFADYDGNDFHLTWNSPCINRGDPNGDYTGETDIDGEDRVIDGRVDMGADEFNLAHINLVKNPGFELGGGGQLWQYVDSNYIPVEDANVPLHWEARSVDETLIDSNSHSDDYSWKISSNNKWRYSYGFSDYPDYIRVDRGRIYKLSAWVRSENGDEEVHFGWREYDSDKNHILYNSILTYDTVPTTWTNIEGFLKAKSPNTAFVRMLITGPTRRDSCEGWHGGAIWWDDVSLTEQTEFLPAYGRANDPNVARSIDFGEPNDDDPDYNGGIVWNTSSMEDPCTDANDINISYREIKANNSLIIQFPAFNVDANGFPLTPMLLEVVFKDTVDDGAGVSDTVSYNQVFVYSKVDYNGIDPDYNPDNYPNVPDPYYRMVSLGGKNANKWHYIQHGFPKTDHQLLVAIDDKFFIKVKTLSGMQLPVDYVTLRKISDQEYTDLTEKQKQVRLFYEVQMPADNPDNPSYDDPNLVVFSRDIMRPVYKHTKPGPNEPNSITGFSCWGEVEPVSFSIYSETGINDLSITVSDLTHFQDSNHVIDSNNISIYHVIYDEARLRYYDTTMRNQSKSYALIPERLVQVSTLSIDPNTSERIWMKVWVPASGLGGLYEGQVIIARSGEPNVTVPIDFTVYDFELDLPEHINPVYLDPFSNAYWLNNAYSMDLDKVFDAYREVGFDPFISSIVTHRIFAEKDPCDANDPIDPNEVVFDTDRFEESLSRMINEGFAKDLIFAHIPYTLYKEIYVLVTPDSSFPSSSDPNLYEKLSDPNFSKAYGRMIEKYIEIGDACGVDFIFSVSDEPGNNPYRRILCDRFYSIMKNVDANYVEPNDPNYVVQTTVTYNPRCDQNCPSGSYNVPFEDGNIPPLTDLVDYKVWAMRYTDDGYAAHQDSNYPGIFCYYTTHHSDLGGMTYNRFLHGLFAFATDSSAVSGFAMGCSLNKDCHNVFRPSAIDLFPRSSRKFFYAYPTWNGELQYRLSGLEAIREGIKDAKYIATLNNLIVVDQNAPVAQVAQDYLDALKPPRIDPNYYPAYAESDKMTEIGYYPAILEHVSDTNDPNDFEAFRRIRNYIADYIILLDSGIDYRVHNIDKDTWYTTIQDAIDDANDGEEIVVYEGTYYESIDFNDKAITLRSTNPNDWDVVEATIIDANSDANNPGRVVTFDDGEDANSILTGFTITGGYVSGTGDGGGIYCEGSSPTISKCVIQYNYAADDGGGIFCYDSSSPSISYCRITDNDAGDGGGICCDNGSSPTISDCQITDNEVDDKGGAIYCKTNSNPTIEDCEISLNNANMGGGIYCRASDPQIEDCNVSYNYAGDDAGGIYCYDGSSPTISDCRITDNEAEDKGGAIYCKTNSDPTIEDCEISLNDAYKGGGIYCASSDPQIERCIISGNQTSGDGYADGGGIYCSSSSPGILNCIISDNVSDDDAGGIYCYDGSDPNIINCTFSGNQADDKGGAIYCKTNGDAVITNCILWDDTASNGPEIYTSSSSPVVSYSDVEGGFSGTDNIDSDPLFDADYHLDPNSPCIDVGDPNGDYDGQVDIDGDERVIDIAGKGDGNVDVDMGADEFKPD